MDDATTFSLHRGATPLLVSLPHAGTAIPAELAPRFLPRALAVEDTDWHLETVYGFARAMGASLLVPRLSRDVVDLNRPPEDAPMYPGANNTGLCPVRAFSGEPLYRDVSTYLREEAPPWPLDPVRADRVGAVLGGLLQAMLDWRPDGDRGPDA